MHRAMELFDQEPVDHCKEAGVDEVTAARILNMLMERGGLTLPDMAQFKVAVRRMQDGLDRDTRHGLLGFIQTNWPKLCTCKCDCGSLVSYEAVRRTGNLVCNNCVGKWNAPRTDFDA